MKDNVWEEERERKDGIVRITDFCGTILARSFRDPVFRPSKQCPG